MDKQNTLKREKNIMTLPNILTLFRIAVIPVLVLLFFKKGETYDLIKAALFSLACFTDFLDGYVARIRGEISTVGRFLDPIADKLLIAATLLMLAGVDRISGISLLPAVVILCREILVSGLREFLSSLDIRLPVSTLAKWKTGIQMFALIFLLLGNISLFSFLTFETIGLFFLWAAAFLTLVTGYSYFKESIFHFKD